MRFQARSASTNVVLTRGAGGAAPERFHPASRMCVRGCASEAPRRRSSRAKPGRERGLDHSCGTDQGVAAVSGSGGRQNEIVRAAPPHPSAPGAGSAMQSTAASRRLAPSTALVLGEEAGSAMRGIRLAAASLCHSDEPRPPSTAFGTPLVALRHGATQYPVVGSGIHKEAPDARRQPSDRRVAGAP